MELGPVTKIDKENKNVSKKFENDVIYGDYDVIAIVLLYGRFGVIWNPDFGHIVYKTYIFINRKLQNYKHSLENSTMSEGIIFAKKC